MDIQSINDPAVVGGLEALGKEARNIGRCRPPGRLVDDGGVNDPDR